MGEQKQWNPTAEPVGPAFGVEDLSKGEGPDGVVGGDVRGRLRGPAIGRHRPVPEGTRRLRRRQFSPTLASWLRRLKRGQEESPEAEAEWPEDLEPELKEFLEAELALFEGLQGVSHLAEHKILLRDDKPLKQRYYPKNPAMQRVIEQMNELIQAGAIEPSRSPHSAPIVLVRKKTGD
ncbi:hypothetical protein ACLKA7_005535 [Drosophila subpalustris]